MRLSALRQSGFTLIEMLVAMTIFSILMGVLMMGLSQGLSLWDRAREKVSRWQALEWRAQLLQQVFEQALASDYPVGDGGFLPYFEGTPETMTFLSAAPMLSVPGAVKAVQLRLEKKDDAMDLVYREGARSRDPYRGVQLDEQEWLPLLKDLAQGSFRYEAPARLMPPEIDPRLLTEADLARYREHPEWMENYQARRLWVLPQRIEVQFAEADGPTHRWRFFFAPIPMSGRSTFIMALERSRRQPGFVLPLALIVLALLSALAMGLSQIAGSRTQQALMSKQRFEGYLDAHNAMHTALYLLLTAQPGPRVFRSDQAVLPIDGTALPLAGLTCRVQDVAGLLGLGAFEEEVLARLLLRLTDEETAARLAARLGDWLDDDGYQRYRGMEAADYIAAGSNVVPRNGPLRTLDELLEIPGMTPELFNGDRQRGRIGLRDLLTAGGSGWLNAAAAPRMVLGAYLHIDDSQASAIVQARKEGDWERFHEEMRSGRTILWELPPDTPGREFRVVCETEAGRFARFQIQLNPRLSPPYWIRLWQYPDYGRESDHARG